MKKKIQANELVDADVRFISLVPKGANYLPIRVTKSKEGTTTMNIKGFEGLFEKEVSTAYVASFVVSKEADLELAKAKIEKAGFKVSDVEDKDGVTVFHQKSAPEDVQHQYVVKTSDDIGVHVVCTKSFTPYDYETKSFKELFAKAGVLPNIFMAHEVLKEVIMNALYANDTTDSSLASKAIKKALSEFSAMVTGMVEQIPVSAFKIEDPTLIAEVKKEMLEKSEENKEEGTSEDEAEVVKNDEDAKEEVADEGTEEGEESEEGAVEKSEGEEEDKEAEEADESESKEEPEDEKDTLGDIAKSIAELAKSVDTLKESVSGIDKIEKGLNKLEVKVEEVSKVANAADEAMSGLTNADAEGDRSVTTKSAPEHDILKDTAYSKVK